MHRRSSRLPTQDAGATGDSNAAPFPVLSGEGRLFDPQQGWPWPFLVISYLPGASLGESALSPAARRAVAAQAGRLVRRLHARLPVENSWQPHLDFLDAQRQGCAARHHVWGSLPGYLVDQVDAFLLPSEALIDPARAAHWIHADLTGDHLLVSPEGRLCGVIDFSDAMPGGLLYELGALYFDAFDARRAMLRAFLAAYRPGPALRRDFPRRALSAALLHRFDLFAGLARQSPNLVKAASLNELAERLYGGLLYW